MDLSIIIISYNTRSLLEKCLNSVIKSLEETKIKAEIIVVDNESTDGSKEYVKSLIINGLSELTRSKKQSVNPLTGNKILIKLIENKENLGFGKANNQGIEEARGEYVLLLNSDTEVLDRAIEKLFSFAKKNKQIDFVGGKLFNIDGTAQPSCGPFFSLLVVFAQIFLRGDKLRLIRFSPSRTKEVDWISGACILAKKKCLEEISGFDENFFMYMEEVELCYRAKKKGFRVFFFPGAHFTHLGTGSSQGKTEPIINLYRGFLYFYEKHRSEAEIIILKIMLKLKAGLSYFLGLIFNNQYLKTTYEKAYHLVRF